MTLVFYQGVPLFRDGKPAMSLDCCCSSYPYKACVFISSTTDMRANINPEIDPPLASSPNRSRIVFHGRAQDVINGGDSYHTHLWVLEVCYVSPDDLAKYMNELLLWENNELRPSWHLKPPLLSPSSSNGGVLPNCSDDTISNLIDNRLRTPPGAGLVREFLFGPIARNLCPEAVNQGG